MHISNLAILGAGNMGTSLLGGLIKNHYPAKQIFIADPDPEKLKILEQKFKVHTASHNLDAIKNADVIILAVKPQIIHEVCSEITETVRQHKPLIISIAAGVNVSHLETWLGNNIPIIRTMPNTPALIGCGATALFANSVVSPSQLQLAESLLKAVGITVKIDDEKLMDVVTALSGSGPAYFFLIIEALQNAAKSLGLPEDIAKLLTVQTAYGATRMALESTDDVISLRRHVTSPGGTTEQGIKVLEDKKIRDIMLATLQAAAERSQELAKKDK